jgi:C4-dicarboxylate transporter DctM subunit
MGIGTFLIICFLALLFLNVPIAVALGLSSLICLVKFGLSMDILPIQIYSGTVKFLLLAIPYFIFAGNIMDRAGISEKLIRLCKAFIGHLSSGLSIVTVVTSCFFAAISGSGPATVAALGGILIPAMMKEGYGKASPSALMATSGSIGVIIPPSIPFVIFGMISGVSVGKLFAAGIIPGILMGACLIGVSLLINRNNPNIVRQEKVCRQELFAALKSAFWGLMMPVVILGGIYGGIFTPTEAAIVACFYGLFVGFFIYRTLTIKILYEVLRDTVISSGNVMFIVACASFFAWFCSTSGLSRMAIEALTAASSSQVLFLLIVNVILLIAGCFMETGAALYIFVPIMLPVALKLGYDPVALGVMMVINLAIGQITPPVGINLYVACDIAKINIKQISVAVLPFAMAAGVALLAVTYFPQIYLWLPKLMGM